MLQTSRWPLSGYAGGGWGKVRVVSGCPWLAGETAHHNKHWPFSSNISAMRETVKRKETHCFHLSCLHTGYPIWWHAWNENSLFEDGLHNAVHCRLTPLGVCLNECHQFPLYICELLSKWIWAHKVSMKVNCTYIVLCRWLLPCYVTFTSCGYEGAVWAFKDKLT